LIQIGHPFGRPGEAQIVNIALDPQHPRQPAPAFIAAGRDRHPAVLGLEYLIGAAQGVDVATRHRRLAAADILRRLMKGGGDAGLEQRRIDKLPLTGNLAMVKCRGNAHGAEHAGHHVADRRAGLQRNRLFARTEDAHQAAHALGDQIDAAQMRIRPGAPETRNAAIDQRRVDFAQHLIAEAKAVHRILQEFFTSTSAFRTR